MRKFLTLCAIALVALFSCSKPNEQIPEETIQDLSEAQSILPDEIQVTSDGAPATKAGVIDAEDAKVLGNENLLKFYWDNDDEIDIFGYDGEYIRSLLYKVTNVDETNVYSRFEVKIRKQNSWPISGMIDLIANDDISVVNPAFVAIYPHGLVSEDYGESYYNGAWTAPTNENPTHYVKMKLPSSYELDPTSRGGDNYINVRGMRLQSPMLGLYRLDGGITFYHLAGVLKIDFTGIADGVKYFKVNAPGKKISGEYNVPINAKTSPRPYIALADTDDAAEQTIEFTYGSALDSGAENGTENHVLYIPLPVGTYDQGITVDVYNGDNVLVGQWGVSSLTIGRGALKYTSSFAVERIIEPDSNSNVICVAPMVSITGSNPTKGVAVNFADQSLEDVELTYGDYPQYYPKHVYIAGNSNTSVGVVSGNLNQSTVDFLGGNYAGCEMTTAANTLNIRKGANVGTINIKGGNAKVSGGYQNIIVDENATADGVSAPVNVTITSTATAMSATTPTVTINAPTNLVIAKPVDSDKEDITVINVVVAATDANTTGTAVSNLTVGENVNVHFVAATGTDVNIETVVATDDDDANGAVTYDGVAQIGSTTYASLAAAIAAVPTDGTKTTIQMIADETMETGTALTIAANQNIVLDLNGKTVTGNGGLNGATFHLITNKGTLEITDSSAGQNGKLTGYWTSPNTGYSNEFNTIYNLGGTLTLSAGTVETTSSYLSYAINNSSNAWGIGDDKETVFIMTGGTINSPSGDAGLRVYQNCAQNVTPFSHNTVTISGGTIATGGIFLDNYIYNPNANTTGSGILTTVTISGGEIHGLIDMKMRHAFNTTFNITGGTFVDSKLWVRKHSEWNSVVAEPTAPVFFISGGNFTFVQNKAFGLAYDCSGTSWTSYTQPYSITGGTFNVDPAAFVAAGYEEVDNGNGTWTVDKMQDVAQIGNVKYETLAAAVAAATDGATITLVADIDFSEAPYADYKWAGSTYNPLEICVDNITLDLNNHTISNMGNCGIAFGKILAKDGRSSNITIKNGTLLAGKTDNVTNSYVLAIAGIDGATIKNVTTNGGINVFTGSTDVVIEDCNINGTKYYTVCAQTGSDVTIKGTTFTKNTDSSVATPSMFWVQGAGTDSDCKTDQNPTGAFGPSSIVIEGGEYTIKSGGSFYLTGSGNVKPTVKGGTFNIDPSACVAEGYEATQSGNVWTVDEIKVAQIGSTTYASLADAVEAATSGQTIKILKDFTIEGNAGVTIPAGKSITLDLNGKTIKNLVNADAASQLINNKGTLTITDSSAGANGTMTNEIANGVHPGSWSGYNYSTSIIANAGTLIIESGNINQVATSNLSYAIDNVGANTSTTINGGTIEAGYIPVRSYIGQNKTVNIHGGALNGLYALYLQSTTTLTIDSGTFNAPTRNAIYVEEASTITISNKQDSKPVFNYATDRQFVAFDNTSAQTGSTVNVYAGQYSSDPTEFLTGNYVAEQKGDVWDVLYQIEGTGQGATNTPGGNDPPIPGF